MADNNEMAKQRFRLYFIGFILLAIIGLDRIYYIWSVSSSRSDLLNKSAHHKLIGSAFYDCTKSQNYDRETCLDKAKSEAESNGVGEFYEQVVEDLDRIRQNSSSGAYSFLGIKN